MAVQCLQIFWYSLNFALYHCDQHVDTIICNCTVADLKTNPIRNTIRLHSWQVERQLIVAIQRDGLPRLSIHLLQVFLPGSTAELANTICAPAIMRKERDRSTNPNDYGYMINEVSCRF